MVDGMANTLSARFHATLAMQALAQPKTFARHVEGVGTLLQTVEALLLGFDGKLYRPVDATQLKGPPFYAKRMGLKPFGLVEALKLAASIFTPPPR